MGACLPSPTCKEHRDEVRGCRECRFRGEKVSKAEVAALQRMEDSLVRREDGKLHIEYPFNAKALRQKDNKFQAKQIQERVEENVERKGVSKEYANDFRKAISAGTLRELNQQELREWVGP